MVVGGFRSFHVLVTTTFATVFGSLGKKTIQTPSFHYFWDLYISEIEKTNSTETSFRF